MREARSLGTVLVTGGASGLGAAVVDAVTDRGGMPVILDVNPPMVDVPFEKVDVTDRAAVERAVQQLAAQVGGLDAIVTAAGIDRCGPFAEVPASEWERVIGVNLLGTVSAVRAALPFLMQRNGRIVTVASTLGLRVVSDATAYSASKFGVVGFTRALTTELQGRVGVTLLVPGGMRTGFFDGRDPQYQPGTDADLGDPRHVADVVCTALAQPPGLELREIVVTPPSETSWP